MIDQCISDQLGSGHAGFIMYVSDPAHNQEDIDAMCPAPKESNYVWNFLYCLWPSPSMLHAEDALQVSDVVRVARDRLARFVGDLGDWLAVA